MDALSFLDNVLETSEKTDMEDKISSGSLLEGEKEGQGTSEKNCIQEPSHQHSELTHSMDQSP